MIKIGVFGAIITILAGTVASASNTDWGFAWIEPNGGVLANNIGTYNNSTDGCDRGIDALVGYPMNQVNVGYFPRYVQGEDWSGPTGWWNGDFRAPLNPGETKTWDNIYCWVAPYVGPSTIQVLIQPYRYELAPPSDWTYKMYLDYVPDGVVYNGPREWSINPTTGTLITLPAYKSTIGTDGLRLRFTATATPEPASVFALAGGALGLFGLARRRK